MRFVEGATEVIYDTLRRCGMNWDEGPDVGGPVGPYIQSQRKDLYLPYAQQLVKTGHAYYCFCTKEELEERRAACEAKGEVFKYDKHCLAPDAGGNSAQAGCGRAVCHSPKRADDGRNQL